MTRLLLGLASLATLSACNRAPLCEDVQWGEGAPTNLRMEEADDGALSLAWDGPSAHLAIVSDTTAQDDKLDGFFAWYVAGCGLDNCLESPMRYGDPRFSDDAIGPEPLRADIPYSLVVHWSPDTTRERTCTVQAPYSRDSEYTPPE